MIITHCLTCKKEIKTYPSTVAQGRSKYCSKKCFYLTIKDKWEGASNPRWKNGRSIAGAGYVAILMPEHPMADSKGYVMEHRLVMEQHLGRYLDKKEIVHHLNHIRDDNRVKNLMLLESNSKHAKLHFPEIKGIKQFTKGSVPWNKGKHWTDAMKKKMSDSTNKYYQEHPEIKEQIRKTNTGKKRSPEAMIKWRESMKKRFATVDKFNSEPNK